MRYPQIKECEICKSEFVIENFSQANRKYCFNCSPIGRGRDWTFLFKAMKNEAIKRKGGACQKCGYNKCMAALVFHHRDPKKKNFMLSMHSGQGQTSWKSFWAEAEQCDLLCANCHMEEHYL